MVEEYWRHDWAGDELTKQTWRVPRPGQLERYSTALETTEGRIAFAGADYARGWCGYMDGAVETAMRSAREVRAILSNGPVA